MSTVRSIVSVDLTTGGAENVIVHTPTERRLYKLDGWFTLSVPATVSVIARWNDGNPQAHVFASGPQPAASHLLQLLSFEAAPPALIVLQAACTVPHACRISAALQVL